MCPTNGRFVFSRFVTHRQINKRGKNFNLRDRSLIQSLKDMSAQFSTPVNLHGTNGTQEDSKQSSYSVKAGLAQMLKVSLFIPPTPPAANHFV
jgi:hypothetical protein